MGLALLGLCTTLAIASYTLPYMTIRVGPKVFLVMGAEQTANLHLTLAATGALGAVASLTYALSRRPMPVTFFAIGGIALGLGAFLLLDTHHSVSQGWIRDPKIYAALARKGAELRLGSALYAALITSLGILVLAVAVLALARAAAPPATTPRPGRARR